MVVADLFHSIYNLGDFVLYKVVPIVIVVWLLLEAFKRNQPTSQKNKQPRAKQLKIRTLSSAQGIIFGRKHGLAVFSPGKNDGHVIIFGGSGLGKTSSVLIPTLCSWNGTSFTIDISGDIHSNVDMPNKLVYEPENASSVPYSVFNAIDSAQEEDKHEHLERLAYLLMPESVQMSDASLFFNNEGRKILTASLIAFYDMGMDFIPICEKIFQSDWKTLFNAIEETENPYATQYLNSFVDASEQNTSGCKQAVDGKIKLFATNEKIKRSIRRPGNNEPFFAPGSIEKNNVFVVIDDAKLKLYSPLLRIITAQSLEFFSERPNNSCTTILFSLDEFASLGKMDLLDALRKLRKKNVRIMLLTQSLPDIDLIYGVDERRAMMNNFRFKVIMSADDTDTQDYFAKLIGKQKATRKSVSSSANQKTTTESESDEWIIEPHDLAHLGNHLILLHPDGWMKLRKNFYFKKPGIIEIISDFFN